MTKILVVDDEPGILESTRLLLTDLGFEVVTSSRHEEVLDLLRSGVADVLLQDLRMPGLEIEDLVGAIRADARAGRTPILLFSASMDLSSIEARLAVDGVVEKPFSPDELVERISAALGVAAAR